MLKSDSHFHDGVASRTGLGRTQVLSMRGVSPLYTLPSNLPLASGLVKAS